MQRRIQRQKFQSLYVLAGFHFVLSLKLLIAHFRKTPYSFALHLVPFLIIHLSYFIFILDINVNVRVKILSENLSKYLHNLGVHMYFLDFLDQNVLTIQEKMTNHIHQN